MIFRSSMLALVAALPAIASAFGQEPDLPATGTRPDVARFQVDTHDFTHNGVDVEIFIRLDRHTGQAWRFNASNPKWTPIAEAKQGPAPEATDHHRYELFVHDYQNAAGEAEEMFMRMDLESGQAWSYRGVNPSWQPLAEGTSP